MQNPMTRTISKDPILIARTLYPSILLVLTLAVTKTPDSFAAVIDIESSVPSPAATVLPTPTNVSSGTTVSLQCGQIYQGTLDLNGKSNVTVNTAGTCGKASITPGKSVSGWTQYQGNIYSAPIDMTPVQVAVAGRPVDAAHWPNRPQMWVGAGSAVPNSDLDGATLVYLENQSIVQTRTISGGNVDTSRPFYVEGKLWMLDSPGEWAVSNGRLYLWAPDGQSPEGRTWAASNSNGINADYSSGITIDGVKIFSAAVSISANTSTNLRLLNSDIINSARDGIWASGSKGLTIDSTNVVNSVRNGISGGYAIEGAVITGSNVGNTGTVGRSKPSDAGIMFGGGSNNRIDNVEVTNSSYHGINVLSNRNTVVTNSVVDAACVGLTDCGGIYTGGPDQQPLGLRIEGNTVKNVQGREGVGIYLDGSANGVAVTQNTISDSKDGMLLHDAFDNVITGNIFRSNTTTHIIFSQDKGEMRNNRVTNNTFSSTNGEQTFNLQGGSNLRTFAAFDNNTYTSTNANQFGRIWDGASDGITHTFGGWKNWSGQDAGSTMNGAL